MIFFAVWILLLQIAQSAAAPAVPASPGVYYRQDNGGWIRLGKAVISRTKTKGLDLFVQTGGFSNLETDVVCSGASAATRISVPRPAFFVRGIGSPTDVALIRLTQKRSSRTFHISSGNATVENKGGFNKDDIRKSDVSEYPDGAFSVTPVVDLEPGEFLLVVGSDAETGFDFGIDPKK